MDEIIWANYEKISMSNVMKHYVLLNFNCT